MIKLTHYSPKGRPKYSSSALRFALLLRYTSNSGYNFLKKHLPLPSETLLKSLNSNSFQGDNALSGLRDRDLIGNDVVLLFDEMHLQQQVFFIYETYYPIQLFEFLYSLILVQFDGKIIIGCDGELEMYKSILCFMVISLKKTIPFVLKAIPIVKLSTTIISHGILNCLTILSQSNLYTRAVIADNHRNNIRHSNTCTIIRFMRKEVVYLTQTILLNTFT